MEADQVQPGPGHERRQVLLDDGQADTQRLVLSRLLQAIHSGDRPVLDEALATALGSVMRDPALDPAFKELLLQPPSQAYVAEQLQRHDPQRVHVVREQWRALLAERLHADWARAWQQHQVSAGYSPRPEQMGPRALANLALQMLCLHAVAHGDVLGTPHSENVQGEVQKKLDIISNEVLIEANEWGGHLAAMASDEMDSIHVVPNRYPQGEYMLLFDPLDGSSNIDVNVSIGTIFSVLRKVGHARGISEEDFLQPGKHQAAAGYCVYGPQTMLVLTVGNGVAMFTLDRETGSWVLTQHDVRIPADTQEFAINMSNMRHWAAPVRTHIDECLAGRTGPRGKDFNMRRVASMVADVHRIVTRGGVFLYPWDQREPDKPGKLRLMYEANAMAFVVEQAGGMATNGRERILDLVPGKLHERVSVMLGSKHEVEHVTALHRAAG